MQFKLCDCIEYIKYINMSENDTKTEQIAKPDPQNLSARDSRKICLVSQEGDSFEVTSVVAAMSELVKTLIWGM